MSAYLNALREEGSRNELLRQIEKLYAELTEAATEVERLRALLKEVRDECLFDDHDLFARVCDALEGVSVSDIVERLRAGEDVFTDGLRPREWIRPTPKELEAAAEIERLRARLAEAVVERYCAQSTLTAWFDLSKKAEDAGASILESALDTWMRRASNGGMLSEHADIVRNVVTDAARLYLWRALVPVLRTLDEEREARLAGAVGLVRGALADFDHRGRFEMRMTDPPWVPYARAFLAKMEGRS